VPTQVRGNFLSQRLLFAVVVLLAMFVPATVYGQASIAGVVSDASGAVLPGVTVEASSPVLIEGTRVTVSDGSGRYRIEALRPGTYTVTFALPGFSTVRREGIELVGTATATVDADLRVGAVTETITVTGAAPTVDMRSIRQERVINRELLDTLPFGRTPQTAALLTPGASAVSTFGAVEIGGTNIIMTGGGLTSVHGSRGGDSRVTIDGLSTSGAEGEGAFANLLANIGLAQEVTVNYASGTAEQALGGVQTNIIPRDGGNTFKVSAFASGTWESLQGSNYTQDLKDRGLRTPNGIKETWDINPAVGGPVVRARVWFFTSGRWVKNANYVGGMFYNRNALDPAAWTYDPDQERRAFSDASQPSRSIRLTWQATPKNKISGFYDSQNRCQCPNPSATIAPEATSPGVAGNLLYSPLDMLSFGWTAPFTSRLLVEARTGTRRENYTFDPADHPFVNLINVTEQAGLIPGLSYRGGGVGAANQPYLDTDGLTWNTVGSVAYVTGSHSIKVGFGNLWNRRFNHWEPRRAQPQEPGADYVAYRFNNGVPNQLTQRATPYTRLVKQPWDLGIYAQDAWTMRRLTVNAGIRFDRYRSYAPETHLGPGPLVPTRDITFPETEMLSFKDIVPRLGATIDLFGTQKTALKIGLNKYTQALGTQVGFMNGALDPVSSLALFVTRSWNDSMFPAGDPRRGNFVPDCDLVNVAANGECGVVSDTNFGRPTRSTSSDPDTVRGWGNRPYQWEFSIAVDHELAPRVSASAGFFRRSFGNFTVVDNLALAATDFTAFSVTAPVDSRLPDGGGYTISPFLDRNPDTLSRPADNRVRLASEYGDQEQAWSGVDLSVNARMPFGATISGGISTGRTRTDNCDILAQVPEAGLLGVPYCRQVTDYLTDFKIQGAYTIPKADVQVGVSFRSSPGPVLAANLVVPNAVVRESLGRDLSGGAANVTVNLVPPGAMYGDRLNQLDLRFGKVLRAGPVRTVISVDVYNSLNVNPVLAENPAYRDASLMGWRIPTSILPARFVKFGAQVDF
jgi:hypothetical protein